MPRSLAIALFLSALGLAACSQTGAAPGPYAEVVNPHYATDASGDTVIVPGPNYGEFNPWGNTNGTDWNTGPNTMYLTD